LSTGLIATLLLKYANASINPFWATTDSQSGGWNKTCLTLAAISLFEYAYRPLSLHPAAGPSAQKVDSPPPTVTTTKRLAITLGLGSLIHLIQTFITDAGTVISWTWTGYPISGPTLHPFAGVFIATSAIAVALSLKSIPGPFLPLLGTAGAVVLYRYKDWLGFAGGLLLVIYLIQVTPLYLRAASYLALPSIYGNTLLVNALLDVASVVTAAYAFVPFGWILRERTDLIIGFCMLSIVAGQVATEALDLPSQEKLHMRSRVRIANINRWTKCICALLGVTGMAYSYSKMPTATPIPYYPYHRLFSAGIWTVS
jgi:hypothetical protein